MMLSNAAQSILIHFSNQKMLQAKDIGKKTNIGYTHVYPALLELINSGLAEKIVYGGRFRFSIFGKTELKKYLQSQQKQLLAQFDFPELKRSQEKSKKISTEPVMSFYSGVEGVKRVAESILETKSETVYTIASIKGVLDMVDQPYLAWWFSELEKRKIKSKSLWSNKHTLPEFQHSRRNLRLIPSKLAPENTFVLFDTSVAVFSGTGEVWAFSIRSEQYYSSMMNFFEQLWDQSKEV